MLNIIGNIKDTISLLAVVSTMLLGWMKYNDAQEISRLENNLHSTTIQYEDKLGRTVTEVTELRFTNKELKQIAKLDSSKLSDTQKKLWEASQVVKDLEIKSRNAESFNRVDLSVSNDSLISEVIYNEDRSLKELKPIKTKHLSITFEVVGDTVLVAHKYNATIDTVVSRSVDKETKSGKKRFFLVRWVNPRWKYSAKNVSDDKNATIEKGAIHINFQRGKGKR